MALKSFQGAAIRRPWRKRIVDAPRELERTRQERDILKKLFRSSRTASSEIPVHGSPSRRRCWEGALRNAGGLGEWLLRLEKTPDESARPSRCASSLRRSASGMAVRASMPSDKSRASSVRASGWLVSCPNRDWQCADLVIGPSLPKGTHQREWSLTASIASSRPPAPTKSGLGILPRSGPTRDGFPWP